MAEDGVEAAEVETGEERLSVSERLDRLVELDQEHRGNAEKYDPRNLDPITDRKNREEVQRMIDAGGLTSPDDYRKASLIFVHGDTLNDLSKAFDLSIKAAELGMPLFATLIAQSVDKYMVLKQIQQGKQSDDIKQRFGTQMPSEGVKPYQLDGLATQEESEMFTPVLVGFSAKTPEEQKTIYQQLQNKWQNLSAEDRQRKLNKIKDDFASF